MKDVLENRRSELQDRDPVFRNRLKNLLRAKAFLQEECSPFVKDGGRLDEEASRMKQGSGGDHDIFGGEMIHHVCIQDIKKGLSMRKNRPFRNTCRPGGVHKDMGIFTPDGSTRRGFIGWLL
jgi:hypothetical protein